MNAMFYLQIHVAYNKFLPNKKAYELPDFLLGYGRGEIPSHGRIDQVWGVDVDRLYFLLFVNGNQHSSRILSFQLAFFYKFSIVQRR